MCIRDSASTSLPANWTGSFSVSSTHGVSSNGLYKNLWSSSTSAYVTTPPVGPLTDNTTLQFDYRYVEYSGYPATAHTLVAGDKLEIQISTDGTNFTTIHTIDSSNHITSNSFATCTVPITQTKVCLLYTSDAADDLLCVALGGRRLLKKKKNNY